MMSSISPTLAEALQRCTRCGLCLPSCPVYARSRRQVDSPRGQLALVQAWAEGRATAEDIAPSLARCLLCGRCAKACPAELPLTEIFFAARQVLRLPLLWRQVSRLLALRVRAADFVQAPLAVALNLLPARKAPKPPLAPSPWAMPQGNGSGILFFSGCLMRRFFPFLANDCVDALRQNGHQVITLPALPCCGRPLAVQGQDITPLVRRWLKLLAGVSLDALVTPCPGCLHTFTRLWPNLPSLNDAERQQARNFAVRCKNLLEMLDNVPGWHGEGKIYWHQPCLETAQAASQAQKLLRDYDICQPDEAPNCCGAALHCLPQAHKFRQRAALQRLNERKTPNIREVLPLQIQRAARRAQAAIIATSCPGCRLFLSAVPTQGNTPLPVRHPLEILLERPGK